MSRDDPERHLDRVMLGPEGFRRYFSVPQVQSLPQAQSGPQVQFGFPQVLLYSLIRISR